MIEEDTFNHEQLVKWKTCIWEEDCLRCGQFLKIDLSGFVLDVFVILGEAAFIRERLTLKLSEL